MTAFSMSLSSFKGGVSFQVSFSVIFHSLFVKHCLPSLPLLYSSLHSPPIIFQDTLPIFRGIFQHKYRFTEYPKKNIIVFSFTYNRVVCVCMCRTKELSPYYQSILDEITISMDECLVFVAFQLL